MNHLLFTLTTLILFGCTEKRIERAPVFYNEIYLGESIDDVASKIENLVFNYEADCKSNEKCYFSISELPVKMEKGQLYPSIFLKFNSNEELTYFHISYTFNGADYDTTTIGTIIFNTLLENDILPLKGETLNGVSQTKNAIRKTSFEINPSPRFIYEVSSN